MNKGRQTCDRITFFLAFDDVHIDMERVGPRAAGIYRNGKAGKFGSYYS